MTFNKSISGKYYTNAGHASEALVYAYIPETGIFRGAGVEEQASTVILTGWQTTSLKGATMSQLTSGEYIDITDGWQPTGERLQYSRVQAQELLNQIIENNKVILCNNLICARFAGKLTNEQKTTLYNLQSRLNNRNKAMQDNELVTVSTTSAPTGYVELQDYLDSFMSNKGSIGIVISTTVAIVIGATVIAAAATAAYFAFRYYAAESTRDVKFSNDLTKALTTKLTDAEYNQLMKETKGMVTKAALLNRLGTTTKWWLVAGLAAAGYVVYRKFIKKS